jgi:hypothetical protein
MNFYPTILSHIPVDGLNVHHWKDTKYVLSTIQIASLYIGFMQTGVNSPGNSVQILSHCMSQPTKEFSRTRRIRFAKKGETLLPLFPPKPAYWGPSLKAVERVIQHYDSKSVRREGEGGESKRSGGLSVGILCPAPL